MSEIKNDFYTAGIHCGVCGFLLGADMQCPNVHCLSRVSLPPAVTTTSTYGWICPNCKIGIAPWVQVCPRCNVPNASVSGPTEFK